MSRFRIRPHRAVMHSVVVALLTALVVAGGGVTYALWSSAATGTATATGAQLDLTATFADANTIYRNDRYAATGSFSIANTTTTTSLTPGSYSATLSATGDAALASNLTVSVWATTTPASCPSVSTVPGGALTGTWASFTAPITGTVLAGATKSYCVRMSAIDRVALATTDGELLIQPTVAATLTVGSWTDTASSSTTQKTAFVFPASTPTPSTWFQLVNKGTGQCLDAYAAQTTADTGLIDYPCKTANTADDYNQEWMFTSSSAGYYDVKPRHAQTLRMDVEGGSSAGLAAINIQADTTARLSQEWQLQLLPDGSYQVVSKLSGLCIQPYNTAVFAGDTEMAQSACDGTAAQHYTLLVKEAIVPTVDVTCSAATGNGVTYTWTGAAIDTYDFRAQLGASGTWASIGSAGLGSTSITVLPAAVATTDGQYTVQARWGTNLLDTATLWRTTTAGVAKLSCVAPVAPLDALTCAASGTGISVGWGHASYGAYQAQRYNGTTWVSVGTASASAATAVVLAATSITTNGVYDVRVIYGAVVSDTIHVTKKTNVLSCAVPVTCASGTGQVTVSWPTVTGTTNTNGLHLFYGGADIDQKNVTQVGANSRFTYANADVFGYPAGIYVAQLQLTTSSGTTALTDLTLLITNGTGQNRNIACG